ncbi:MAG: hypothetical protein IT459_14825 [Planctomycetes bacterium]|nr:hypothetical protein [Planctomycetota bacterium]
MRAPVVSDVGFAPARGALVGTGLLGWARFTLDGMIRIDGVGVRVTRRRTLEITLPERKDARGRNHPIVSIADACARASISEQVLDALRQCESFVSARDALQ